MLYSWLGSRPDSERDMTAELLPSLVRHTTAWLALLTAAIAAVRDLFVKELCMIWLWPPPSPSMTDIRRNTCTFGVNVPFANRPTWPGFESFNGTAMLKMHAPLTPDARKAVRRLPA